MNVPAEPRPDSKVAARPAAPGPRPTCPTEVSPSADPQLSTAIVTSTAAATPASAGSARVPRRSSGPAITVTAGPIARLTALTTAGSRNFSAYSREIQVSAVVTLSAATSRQRPRSAVGAALPGTANMTTVMVKATAATTAGSRVCSPRPAYTSTTADSTG